MLHGGLVVGIQSSRLFQRFDFFLSLYAGLPVTFSFRKIIVPNGKIHTETQSRRCSTKIAAQIIRYSGYGHHSSPLSGLRSEEHTSELQSRGHLVCRLLLEKKK